MTSRNPRRPSRDWRARCRYALFRMSQKATALAFLLHQHPGRSEQSTEAMLIDVADTAKGVWLDALEQLELLRRDRHQQR